MPDPPRVFLVDDHELFLSGVRAELGASVEIAGSASDVDAAVELIRERVPDVVLVDVHMPGGGGARVIRDVLATHPQVRFLALSVSDAPVDVIATIRAGSTRLRDQDHLAGRTAGGHHRVAEGDAVFSPRLAGFVLDTFAERAPPSADADLELLTGREQEVLRHIARGYTYKEIARDLDIFREDSGDTRVSGTAQVAVVDAPPTPRWATDRRLV